MEILIGFYKLNEHHNQPVVEVAAQEQTECIREGQPGQHTSPLLPYDPTFYELLPEGQPQPLPLHRYCLHRLPPPRLDFQPGRKEPHRGGGQGTSAQGQVV